MLVDSGEIPLGDQTIGETLEQIPVDQNVADTDYFEDTGDQS